MTNQCTGQIITAHKQLGREGIEEAWRNTRILTPKTPQPWEVACQQDHSKPYCLPDSTLVPKDTVLIAPPSNLETL